MLLWFVGSGQGSTSNVSTENMFVEPSTLHKYSNSMRETNFLYLNNCDNDLSVPSLFDSTPSSSSKNSHQYHYNYNNSGNNNDQR